MARKTKKARDLVVGDLVAYKLRGRSVSLRVDQVSSAERGWINVMLVDLQHPGQIAAIERWRPSKQVPIGHETNPIEDMPGGSVQGCIAIMKARKGKSKGGRLAKPEDPGAYCAAIADRLEPGWREGSRKKKRTMNKQSTRKKNVDRGHKDYHRRNVILDSEIIEELSAWSGSQSSATYSLLSLGMNDYVSPSMIDAAVDELEGINKKGMSKADRKSLDTLIGELDARARFSSEFTTKEAGIGDVDSGYAEWLMTKDNPKPCCASCAQHKPCESGCRTPNPGSAPGRARRLAHRIAHGGT